jgi:hypothetical protein
MMTKREKAEMFADLLAQLIQDHADADGSVGAVQRTMTNSGSEMIVTEFEGQKINITICAARG